MANVLDSPMAIRWTRDDCGQLERAGVLPERYELVEGVINTMGQNIRHANMVRLLLAWLFRVFGEDFVLTQMSIDVRPEDNPTSEPQPDVIVVSQPANSYTRNPMPSDLRLLVEASDSTLEYDLSTKASLYARAGIVEYWVLDLPKRQVHVHCDPVHGMYNSIVVIAEAETLAPLAAPLSTIRVTQLLPPSI